MTRELGHYHPRGGEIIPAFVEGINAWVARTEREPGLLPIEFELLGIKPGPWSPEVVVSRHNGLFRNVTSKVQYAQLVRMLGVDRTEALLNLHPGRPSLQPDGALDLGSIQQGLLAPYQRARAPVHFHPDDVGPASRGEPPQSHPEDEPAAPGGDGSVEGSNNWVISGDRSFSRSVILANDPHRTIQLPSLRYWVHLVAPGWDVLGAGEPALPGVSVGHNGHGAWGVTIFPVDQEDLYVYTTDPEDPSRYRYEDAWETMQVVRETVPVKGQADVEMP